MKNRKTRNAEPPTPFITVKEAKKRLQDATRNTISKSAIYRLIHNDLYAVKLGGKVLVSETLLADYIRNLRYT